MNKRKTTFVLPIYGIWSKYDRTMTFVSLDQEEVEFEFDTEDKYSENTHAIVCLNARCDISSLERRFR